MADPCTDAVIGKIVEKLMGYSADAIKKQVRYLCCYSCNVQTLAAEVGELNIKRQSLQQHVDTDRANSRVIFPEVEAWLSKGEDLKTRSEKICSDAEEVKRSWVCKWFPMLHYSLSRKALKTTNDSVQLRNIEFREISTPALPADIPPVPTTSIVGFESRDSTENRIVDALKDPSVHSIGIWGIGGVGKTVMAKQIEKRVRDEKYFERVVMVVVSQQPDLPKIQSQIAEGLSLPLTEDSPISRQRKLHQRLMAEKGILIILDDIWDRMNLEEIGIPSQSTHAGCKLILTSRNWDALTSTGVPIQKIFPLEILTEEESWRFFKDNAGINADDDSHDELVQIAKKVERECMRLPLALKIVACALKGKGISFWKNAVRELEKHTPNNIPGVAKEVYGSLLFSINALEGKEQKDLFLLCCLFPEDYFISIEELVRCVMGLRIFKELENLTEARDKVETVLNILLSHSLLIEGDKKGDNFNVRMHDVIRDVGIWIATKGIEKHVFLIKHGVNEWPTVEDDSFCNYTYISLQFSNNRIVFPELIVFPKLEFLRLDFVERILEYSYYIVELPENFFNRMSGLRVFEAFSIGLLPPSMVQLNNLRTLSLQQCEIFQTVSVLGKLINLEMLSLRNCIFWELPTEIGGLKKLKQMNILNNGILIRIPFGVVSGLVRLEELVLLGCFKSWVAEAGGQEDVACLSELNGLKNLTTLKIEIENPSVVPRQKPLWVQKVKKYHITVSNFIESYGEGIFQKVIQLGEVVNPLGDWIYDLVSASEYLYLEGSNCKKFVKRLLENYENLSCLKCLILSNFTDIQYLVEGVQNNAIFPTLESLHIEYSGSLQQIFEMFPPTGSFVALQSIDLKLSGLTCLWKFSIKEHLYLGNLQSVEINECDNLSYLFSLSVAKSLVQLTDLTVIDCQTIKEIFRKEDGELVEINEIKLSKLRKIYFSNLDSFCRLCNEIDRIELPELSSLNLCDLPRMKMMKGDNNEVHQKYLISKDAGIKFNFCALKVLEVQGIGNFKFMFSLSAIISEFLNLWEMDVRDCLILEQVIGKDEEENIGGAIIFPNLHKLCLSNLPSIRTFCCNAIQLPSLESLYVAHCPIMMNFVEVLPNHILNSRPFFDKQVAWINSNFCRLKSLTVDSIGNIKCMFSLSFIISGLPNLQVLEVNDCLMLEQVIGKDEEENVESAIIFPHLRELMLINLPNIRTFCYNAIQLPSLVTLQVINCPLILKFVEELTDHTTNSRPFLSKQVQCPKLELLFLDKLNISAVFSPLFFKSLIVLRHLELSGCERLEQMITKEEGPTTTNTEEEFIQKIPLVIFILIQMPKLCGSIFQIKHSLEFPLLKEIKIEDCPMLEKFSLGSLRMPKLKNVRGLLSAKSVAKFFSNKEMVSREIHSENNCFIISLKDISFSSNKELQFLVSESSESFVDAVSIALNDGAKEIVGKFKIEKIRIGIEYEVMLMIMLLHGYGWKDPIEIELKLPEESKLQHIVILENHPKDTWIEISIGKFVGEESQQNEQLEFSLCQSRSNYWDRTLSIGGIRIVEV